ncbi:MAG TPA: alpha/beta fold hydrolase, partial [Cellvibrionaceae bacterium]
TKDRKYALMPAFVGTTDLVLGKPLDPNYSVLKVNLNKRTRHKRAGAGSLHSVDFFVDDDGTLVAEERYNHEKNHHSLWAIRDGKLEEVFSETLAIRTKSFVGLTSDFSSVVFLEPDGETGRADYFMLEIASGKITKADFGKSDADIEAVISDSNRVVYGVRYSGFSPSYHFFDSALNSRVDTILSRFPEQSTWIVDQSPDWNHIVIYVEGSSYVGDYYLVGKNNEPVFLASSRKNISHEDVNPIGKITLTARDGLPIPTLLTIPQSGLANMKNLPAVVFPHGGPRSYDRIGFDYFAQALAWAGYLVIQPQFRGSTGFGEAHANAGNGEWGRKMQDDITDTVKALSDKGIINPQKVCIAGMSYGGYAALAGGAFTPQLYKCVVSVNGVANLADMYGYDKNKHGSHHESVAFWEMQFAANADGEVDKAEMNARSPDAHAADFVAPVLLIHAENDQIVPFRQSKAMRSALHKHNKPVELMELKGDNHYLQNSETRMATLEATVNFVNAHLQD